jgi:rSAM/selenodomain-associated transferase 2
VSARAPRISVVIPVLHEADWIDGVIAHTRGLPGGGDCEVIVVDGDPAGDTLAAVAQTGVTGMRAERGRSRQMNAGAAAARGEVLLFLHADTFLPPSAFADVAACLADPACDGGAFRHRFDSPRTVYRLMSALVTLRSRWTRLPFGDQAIFLRRAFFESIGGFAPIPVMEDVELVRRIRRRGGWLRITRSAVVTSRRRLEREGIGRRVVKNWALLVLFELGVPARRLARFYA